MTTSAASRSGGAPFKWPWLTTRVGKWFILTAANRQSAIQSASRVKRAHGVQYATVPMTKPTHFKMVRRK